MRNRAPGNEQMQRTGRTPAAAVAMRRIIIGDRGFGGCCPGPMPSAPADAACASSRCIGDDDISDSAESVPLCVTGEPCMSVTVGAGPCSSFIGLSDDRSGMLRWLAWARCATGKANTVSMKAVTVTSSATYVQARSVAQSSLARTRPHQPSRPPSNAAAAVATARRGITSSSDLMLRSLESLCAATAAAGPGVACMSRGVDGRGVCNARGVGCVYYARCRKCTETIGRRVEPQMLPQQLLCYRLWANFASVKLLHLHV